MNTIYHLSISFLVLEIEGFKVVRIKKGREKKTADLTKIMTSQV